MIYNSINDYFWRKLICNFALAINNPYLFKMNVKKQKLLSVAVLLLAAFHYASGQDLKLNKLEYFETQGVNVLVYNNLFNGGFNDEKNAGIELIHHGVRTAQGGAVRLSNAPEQWDLVPVISNRKVNAAAKTIEATMR